MDTENRIVSLCQVIAHWASKRGYAAIWQERDAFDKYDREVKRWVGELVKRIKENN